METFGIALAITISASCMASPFAWLKKELDKTFHQVTSALQHKDMKAFASFMADDFTATSPAGKVMTREEVINSWKGVMANMHDVTWKRTIKRISKRGTGYETLTDGHLEGKVAGKDKKDHTMVFDATSEDQWEKIDGQWKDHSSKLLKTHSTMDGQEVPGGQGG